MNDTLSTQGAAKEPFEFQATILDRDNRHLASVKVRLWPTLCFGGFVLPPTVSLDTLIKCEATLKTDTGLHIRLLRLHPCTSHHIPSLDGTHVEFDYEKVV
jgi:hypothetical protein